jgi:hypothetical protein
MSILNGITVRLHSLGKPSWPVRLHVNLTKRGSYNLSERGQRSKQGGAEGWPKVLLQYSGCCTVGPGGGQNRETLRIAGTPHAWAASEADDPALKRVAQPTFRHTGMVKPVQ